MYLSLHILFEPVDKSYFIHVTVKYLDTQEVLFEYIMQKNADTVPIKSQCKVKAQKHGLLGKRILRLCSLGHNGFEHWH